MPDRVAVGEATHRLIPSQFPPIDAFDAVTSPRDLQAVMELEGWTNDRLVSARMKRLPPSQWVFGRANASVVMAAFLHAAPQGGRFSSPALGAWYAALSLKTAIAEVAHHLRRQTIYEGRPSGRMTYRAYGARLNGTAYVDIRGQAEARPDLYDRTSYERSQIFGERQRSAGADGILYDSLRLAGGVNAVSFRPTDVADVVQQDHYEVHVQADPRRKAVAIRLSS